MTISGLSYWCNKNSAAISPTLLLMTHSVSHQGTADCINNCMLQGLKNKTS